MLTGSELVDMWEVVSNQVSDFEWRSRCFFLEGGGKKSVWNAA